MYQRLLFPFAHSCYVGMQWEKASLASQWLSSVEMRLWRKREKELDSHSQNTEHIENGKDGEKKEEKKWMGIHLTARDSLSPNHMGIPWQQIPAPFSPLDPSIRKGREWKSEQRTNTTAGAAGFAGKRFWSSLSLLTYTQRAKEKERFSVISPPDSQIALWGHL